ncbi:MAG TPA: hypothetical protein VJZ31_02155, partial [Bacilli bacterium]|nr:hypothetical protein [Bacilli bacterium]
MNAHLTKTNYPYQEKEFIANSFIVGNGRIGYKATMEEETSLDKVTLNIVGVYDQSGDKWRESLNVFNPLFMKLTNVKTKITYHYKDAVKHQLDLDLSSAILKRETVFEDIVVESERFIHKRDNLIVHKYRVRALREVELQVTSGVDRDVYEINGPHYQSVKSETQAEILKVWARTNEDHVVKVFLKQSLSNKLKLKFGQNQSIGTINIKLLAGEEFSITRFANIVVNDEAPIKLDNLSYEEVKSEHQTLFRSSFLKSRISVDDTDTQFGIDYAIYHLLILENEKYKTSIPARGLSGQVYKGAIFWDTEIFMLPFYLLTNPKFARNLIKYRINTLAGAQHKALEFGHKGAFYAWESQEDGKERCSLYNVTDSKTNKPIRTYFADKQIHISADVIYGLKQYLDYTADFDILFEGGFEVIKEVAVFYESYATLIDGQYHFLDVVGPDEYHERVDDNAFTNYHIYLTFKALIKLISKHFVDPLELTKHLDVDSISKFINKIYLPQIDEHGIIEQFNGYFKLEDINVA